MFGSIGVPELIIIAVVVMIGVGVYQGYRQPLPVPEPPPVIDPLTGLKKCRFCAEDIQAAAIVCKHCGRDQSAAGATSTVVIAPQRAWNPGVAIVLSFFVPGAGQLYKGQLLNGLAWFFIVIVGYIALVVPGLILHLCCIISASMGDPYKATR